MKFHALQHDIVPDNFEATRTNIENQIDKAQTRNGDFVVMQEMTDTGWSMDLNTITGIGTVEWACILAKQFGVWIQVGWADVTEGRGKNCVSICSPEGESIATYTKVFTCSPLNEGNFFDSGEELVVVDLGEVTVCPLICYDVRFPELWRPAAIAGVDVFTVSSSWPRIRIAHWRALLLARAIENQTFVVASNRVGQDTLAEWGGNSLLCSPLGEVLAEATEVNPQTISGDINREVVQKWREDFPAMDDVKKELIGKIEVREITA